MVQDIEHEMHALEINAGCQERSNWRKKKCSDNMKAFLRAGMHKRIIYHIFFDFGFMHPLDT